MNRFLLRLAQLTVPALVAAMCVLCACAAFAEQMPTVLFGFEGSQGLKGWTGLPCRLTNSPVSEGVSAMKFTFPKWTTTAEDYPTAMVSNNNGQNYALSNWSAFGKLSFDIWVDGDQPFNLGVRLRGTHEGAMQFLVKPGMMNTCTLEFVDLPELDVSNIREISLFVYRPEYDFAVTVDNFRLSPVEKPALAEFDLVYPNYRGMIFPGVKNVTVTAVLNTKDHNLNTSELSLVLTGMSGSKSIRRVVSFSDLKATVSIPASKLSAGSATLFADVVEKKTGNKLASQSWTLNKLTKNEVAALKVYIDESNNTIVDGKPFFPLGWFSGTHVDQMQEVSDSPFNCLLVYELTGKGKAYAQSYMDEAHKRGLKLLYDTGDIYPSAGGQHVTPGFSGRSWEGITGNDAIGDAVVKTFKDHPAVLAWYLSDEPPKAYASDLKDHYESTKKADPSHPCFIVQDTQQYIKYFKNVTDGIGIDPYPIPREPVTTVSDHTDGASAAVNGHKPIWVCPQAFGWYQYESANLDRTHKPTAEELKTGRAPTFEEERCMTYLALTHGAKGLIYFSYYTLRQLPQYQEMWGWMKKIAGEVKSLSPMLMSADDLGTVSCTPASAPMHTKLKRYNGRLYLMAVNSTNSSCTTTFDVKQRISPRATVMFENRSLDTKGSQLTDDFKPFEVHVYDFGVE